jgi:hypothetical protein
MHVTHLHENRSLTFGELKEVLKLAATGQLEETSEKLDGMNIMFSWDDSLRLARGKSDILAGGLDSFALESKFAEYPSVAEAFVAGFKILEGAITALSPRQLGVIFQGGKKWYSAELVYPTVSNTINYDANSIVFHGWPVLDVKSGIVEKSADDSGVALLSSRVKQMQAAVNQSGWRIAAPTIVRLQDISEGIFYKDVITKLNNLMSRYGMSDNNTLDDYLYECALDLLHSSPLPERLHQETARRLVRKPNAKTITQLTKMSPQHTTILRGIVIKCDAFLKEWIRPIELLISDFAIEVLKGLKSSLVADTEGEVKRLRGRVAKAISEIQASGNEVAMQVLQTQLEKLKSVENIASPVEGVVFIYKGNAYKFVGSFAPAHQILALFRYGRKGVKFNVADLD